MSVLNAKRWVEGIAIDTIPVFARTNSELAQLAARGERAPLADITNVVLHDPLLSLRLLATVNNRRSRLGAEITTAEHAIMMMGVQPFFLKFSQLESIEQRLNASPQALAAVRRTASRAHHGAYQARDWAIHRSDIESEEVFVAAMLSEVPEILLWCFDPERATAITGHATEGEVEFTLMELREALFEAHRVPELLHDLMDPARSTHPRTLNVTLASAIAHHAERGWYGPGLHQDMDAAAAFLHLSSDDAAVRIHRTAVLAARAWRWYGSIPAAAWLPMLPLPQEPKQEAPKLEAQAKPQPRNSQELVEWAIATLRREVGLGRVMFALCSPDRQWLKAKSMDGVAADSPMAGFTLSLAKHHLFTHLLAKPQSVWLHDTNRDNLKPYLTGEITQLIGHGEFFATSIFLKENPLGLLYADGKGLDEQRYHAFKQVGAQLSHGLAQLVGHKTA